MFLIQKKVHEQLCTEMYLFLKKYRVLTLEIEIGDGPWTFLLMVKSCQWVGGCIWIITSALVLFLSFEIEIGDGPGPELDNNAFFVQRLKSYS